MRDIINQVVTLAVRAPSGDNLQPWRFTLQGNILSVFLIPGKDPSLYNVAEVGSYIAHGALLENIVIAAGHFGYDVRVALMPDPANVYHTADVTFIPGQTASGPLFSAIGLRATNRKTYTTATVDPDVLSLLSKVADEGGFHLTFVADVEKRKKIGDAVAQNERILFGNSAMHKFFFSQISPSDKPRDEGFPLATLELPKKAEVPFKLLRYYFVARLFRALGLINLVVKDNAALYSSGSMGVLSLGKGELSTVDWITFGRVFQRVWLTATARNLAFQPLMGIIFLRECLIRKSDALSGGEKEIVDRAYDVIAKETGVSSPIGLFRIGIADAPSMYTRRNAPEIVVEGEPQDDTSPVMFTN